MRQVVNKRSVVKSGSSADTLLIVFKTFADTTWRMFIPPALGAVTGLQLENQGMQQAAVWGAIAASRLH